MEKEHTNGKMAPFLWDNSKIMKEKQASLSLPMGKLLKI